MRPHSIARHRQSPRPALLAGWGLLALVLGLPASLAGQATGAGTRILNRAEVSFQDPFGITTGAMSELVIVEVGQVAGVRLEPPRSMVAAFGDTLVFAHTLTNLGNGPDSFTLAGQPPAGWVARMYLDTNGNGQLDPADQLITGPIALAAGASVGVLMELVIPVASTGSAVQDSIPITATSQSDPAVSDRIVDQVQVEGAALGVTLTKGVDRATAAMGEILTYTIRYGISGSGSATNFQVVDPIPAGALYQPGTLVLNGTTLTDASDADAGRFESGPARIVVLLPAVTAGDSGTVSFQVRTSAVGMLTNVASAAFQTPLGTDSVVAPPVATRVTDPLTATLQKDLLGSGRARVGETIQYRLVYGNASNQAAILAASIVDTLPTGLQFIAAAPAATVLGPVVRWDLGDLAPGQVGEVLLTVSVTSEVRDTLLLRNVAVLSALNATAVSAVAAQLEAIGPLSRALTLTKTADVLDVGLGETAPFTLVVQNAGSEPLTDLEIHDLLPAGGRLAANSARGADSVAARGREVTFYLRGPLAPGASRTIGYDVAVVSAAEAVMENTAFATAEGGQVRSEDAVAWVRLRVGSPMETRAVIGKVWVDLDGDGVQRAGELGLEGAEIWTDDGEVATTDQEGRFSFRNIRPGRHGFRLDPASVPAAYGLAESRRGADLVTLDVTGWTTPRVTFRLVPRGAVVVAAWKADSISGGRLEPVRGPAFDSLFARGTTAELVELRLEAPVANGAAELTYPLPEGWELAPDLSRRGPTPGLGRDRDGSRVVRWQAEGAPIGTVMLRLRPIGSSMAVEPVRLEALRPDAERASSRSRAFLEGPGVEFFGLADGEVLPLDRVFVGVRGEAGQPVTLFDGDSLVAEAIVRGDGVHDFVAVPLAPGPHRLRVRMQNSWSNVRWDSLSVHVSGLPASFEVPSTTLQLVADGRTVESTRVRVLDQWGVPVVTRPMITVEGSGAEPVNPDEDPSSVGVQVRPDASGWLALRLQPGRAVAEGYLRLRHADATGGFPIEVVAASQSLLVAGIGQLGLGASADAMAAVTVRGRLDDRTSIVASYDSRQLDAGRDAFGRNADPLEEAQYPILGDASAQRTMSASRYQFGARVERGFDWLELGDISTAGFGQDLRLAGYRRALPGAAARITTGPVVWQGFGASTSQVLRQRQIRGAGISGPYQLGSGVRNGTEQVAIEVRAEANAARVVSRQVLIRYVDYQIDYQTGVLLLKRPVPAADTYGNSVFITVLYESEGGGPNSQVWGVRAALDGSQLLTGSALDALRIGATWVQESPGAGDHRLLGTDVRLRRDGRFDFGAELTQAQSADSSGIAVALDGTITLLDGAARLSAGWLSVGGEYTNPSNPALRGGTSEMRLAGEWDGASRAVALAHEWQRFSGQEAERRRTALTLRQSLGPAIQVEATTAAEHYQGPSLSEGSLAGEMKVRWSPGGPWSLWTEARRELSGQGAALRPDYIGVGAGYVLSRAVSIELRRRWTLMPDSIPDYTVTDLGVRSQLGLGTEAYGSYQIAGVGGGPNAALIGLRNQLRVGDAWSLNALVERRVGLDRASVFDPVRALPFVQAEESYWSAGLGAEFLPTQAPYRLSARGEVRDGDLQSTRLLTVVGDVSLNQSFALLARQEMLRTEQREAGEHWTGHRYASLVGLAFRPVHSDAVNVLAKLERIDADQPLRGGVVAGSVGQDRTILAVEAIWQAPARLAVAGRVAHRRSGATGPAGGGMGRDTRSVANFIGWRGTAQLTEWVAFQAEARVLGERTSGTRRYDFAPSLVVRPGPVFEVATGYRFGTLQDLDFAVNGGPGWFITAGAKLTEQTLQSVAEFWRARLASNGGAR